MRGIGSPNFLATPRKPTYDLGRPTSHGGLSLSKTLRRLLKSVAKRALHSHSLINQSLMKISVSSVALLPTRSTSLLNFDVRSCALTRYLQQQHRPRSPLTSTFHLRPNHLSSWMQAMILSVDFTRTRAELVSFIILSPAEAH